MYSSQEKIEGYLQRELTTEEADVLDDVIAYNSAFIDFYTNRHWTDLDADEAEVEESERFYSGTGSKELFVDPFTDLVEVELLDYQGNSYLTLTDESEFITYPFNASVKDSIYLRNYRFPDRPASVKVTAKFGPGSVPSDVVMVATMLSGKFLINNIGTSTQTIKKESIEGYSYELMSAKDRDIEIASSLSILDRYKRIAI